LAQEAYNRTNCVDKIKVALVAAERFVDREASLEDVIRCLSALLDNVDIVVEISSRLLTRIDLCCSPTERVIRER
jgi:hypothetical protein